LSQSSVEKLQATAQLRSCKSNLSLEASIQSSVYKLQVKAQLRSFNFTVNSKLKPKEKVFNYLDIESTKAIKSFTTFTELSKTSLPHQSSSETFKVLEKANKLLKLLPHHANFPSKLFQ
jgi:hypothetical protein